MVKPVTPLVDKVGVVTAAAPLTTLHIPVPSAGALPARVAIVVLHKDWSEPAAAAVGGKAIFITTSSVDDAQEPLLIVHLNVTLVPAVKPVTPVVDNVAVVIVAAPLTTLHMPVPIVGLLPDNDVVLVLQRS